MPQIRISNCIFLVSYLLLLMQTSTSFAQWIPAKLSEPRSSLAATSSGKRAYFAGGDSHIKKFKTVDIYDINTDKWLIDSLSEGRVNLAATSVGNLVLFAGGDIGVDYSCVVDIYNTETKKWTQSKLTECRELLTATSLPTKAFFAGGRRNGRLDKSNIVDIYDNIAKKWSTAHLSQGRMKLASASCGTKVFFGGGESDRGETSDVVDIYDDSTKTWTVEHLSQPRFDLAAASVGHKVLFAGGLTGLGESDVVDIYDLKTRKWSTYRLSKGRFDLGATVVGTRVFFAGGHTSSNSLTSSVVDIYDDSNNSWTTSTLSLPRNSMGVTSVGTKAIFAGGWCNDDLWSVNAVDIFDTEKLKDTKAPEILVTIKNNGTLNAHGKVDVEIQVIDASIVKHIKINGEDRILDGTKNKVVLIEQLSNAEELSIEAQDIAGNERAITRPINGGSPAQTEKSNKKKYYGLMIAVEDYADNDIAPLDEPIKDATLLRNILTKKYTFEEEDIMFLKNPSHDDITMAFDRMQQKVGPDDYFVIFYAGHGHFDRTTDIGYWLPADASKTNRGNWYRNSALVEDIRAINSKHTLLISDACFSGGIFKTRAAFNNASAEIADKMKRQSRKAITSGALNTVPDKSIFMKYLLQLLESNDNTYLPSDDLYHEIRLKMKNNATTVPEYGEIKDTGDEGGNFVFIQRGQ